ncbi:MAG: hypothetical protein NUV83_02480 [Candidatus Wolfebacteria bacterium]|nr:hypothetical protein [Candidatus Wolfebacteria bacterium]
MEDSKFKKIIIISLAVLFLLSVFSVGSAIFLYKRITSENVLSTQVVGQNQPPVASELISPFPKNATGFLGLPISADKKTPGQTLKTFDIKGHWIFAKNPGFDYVSKTDSEKINVSVYEDTKILKLLPPKNKGEKSTTQQISFQDFKIDSFTNPYLVIFTESAEINNLFLIAKEIRIFPTEVK